MIVTMGRAWWGVAEQGEGRLGGAQWTMLTCSPYLHCLLPLCYFVSWYHFMCVSVCVCTRTKKTFVHKTITGSITRGSKLYRLFIINAVATSYRHCWQLNFSVHLFLQNVWLKYLILYLAQSKLWKSSSRGSTINMELIFIFVCLCVSLLPFSELLV